MPPDLELQTQFDTFHSDSDPESRKITTVVGRRDGESFASAAICGIHALISSSSCFVDTFIKSIKL